MLGGGNHPPRTRKAARFPRAALLVLEHEADQKADGDKHKTGARVVAHHIDKIVNEII